MLLVTAGVSRWTQQRARNPRERSQDERSQTTPVTTVAAILDRHLLLALGISGLVTKEMVLPPSLPQATSYAEKAEGHKAIHCWGGQVVVIIRHLPGPGCRENAQQRGSTSAEPRTKAGGRGQEGHQECGPFSARSQPLPPAPMLKSQTAFSLSPQVTPCSFPLPETPASTHLIHS